MIATYWELILKQAWVNGGHLQPAELKEVILIANKSSIDIKMHVFEISQDMVGR